MPLFQDKEKLYNKLILPKAPPPAAGSSKYGSSMGNLKKCRIHSSWVRLPTCSQTLFQSSLYISNPSKRSKVSCSVHSLETVAAALF